jgi:hypothetical protein
VAYSIMGGLAVATMLTLVFLPALYVAWFRIKEPAPPEADRPDASDQLLRTAVVIEPVSAESPQNGSIHGQGRRLLAFST